MHPALRPYVAALVAYDLDLGQPGVHVGLPSTTLTLVLPVGTPIDVGWVGDDASRTARWSTVSGLHLGPAAIHHDGHQAGIQLELTVAGARALFGLPAAELAGQLVELGDLGDTVPALRHLPEQLPETSSWPERKARVEAALVTSLAAVDAPGPRAEVGRALARLTSGARVHEVAHEVGYSRRHLTTLVRAECGVSPKEFHRLSRFRTSHRLLVLAAREGRGSLAEVSAQAGYADQAHLTREWVALAGCTPKHWVRTEFPIVQDPERLAPAG